jgi:hypothetical protein
VQGASGDILSTPRHILDAHQCTIRDDDHIEVAVADKDTFCRLNNLIMGKLVALLKLHSLIDAPVAAHSG